MECLINEGVDRIFGIPGEENLDVMDEINEAGLPFVLTRHEQAAAFMAGTVGRLTGKPGVCLSTLGPGATNLVTGVADAYLSNLPMVALVAQAGAARRDPPQKQVLDLMTMFKPVTKKAIDVRGPQELAGSVRRAFNLAGRERPGPVMLQLPEDVMKKDTSDEPVQPSRPRSKKAGDRALESIIRTLERAHRPMAILGHGTIREGAVEEALQLLRRWNVPTGCTWLAAGAFPYDDPLSLGTIGMRKSDLAKAAFEEADAVLLIGYDAAEFQPKFWNRGRDKNIVYLGRSSPPIIKDLKITASAVGDLSHSLDRLTPLRRPAETWHTKHRETLVLETETPANGPKGLVQALRRQLGRDDILVSDVGAHLIWLAKYFPAYSPNTLLLQNGLISMGAAVPSAIAAKLVLPGSKVAAVVGDGGFMMSSAELETAKRLNVGFVTVIFNDGGLGLIREKMIRNRGRASNVDLGSPDIPSFARSFGAEGYSVLEDEFEPVLHDCLERDALAVIDVKVDYPQNTDLF